MSEKYVVCTVVSTFKCRYVVPVSEIEGCDPETFIKDSVTCNDVKEFSQEHLGDTIVDTHTYDEEALLALFDNDNDYLKEWSREQKLAWINNWKVEDNA